MGGTLNTDEMELDTLLIYANPKQKTIDIKGLIEQKTNFDLYDIQGRHIIKDLALQAKATSQSIDVSGLTAGIYIIKLHSTMGIRTKKVVIR